MVNLEIRPGNDAEHPEDNEIKVVDAEEENVNEIIGELANARQNYLTDSESAKNFFVEHANDSKVAFSIPFFYSANRDQNTIDKIHETLPEAKILDSDTSHFLFSTIRKSLVAYFINNLDEEITFDLNLELGEQLINARHSNINPEIGIDGNIQKYLDRVYIIAERKEQNKDFSFRMINPDTILAEQWHHAGEAHEGTSETEGLQLENTMEEQEIGKYFNVSDKIFDVKDKSGNKLFTDRKISITPKS